MTTINPRVARVLTAFRGNIHLLTDTSDIALAEVLLGMLPLAQSAWEAIDNSNLGSATGPFIAAWRDSLSEAFSHDPEASAVAMQLFDNVVAVLRRVGPPPASPFGVQHPVQARRAGPSLYVPADGIQSIEPGDVMARKVAEAYGLKLYDDLKGSIEEAHATMLAGGLIIGRHVDGAYVATPIVVSDQTERGRSVPAVLMFPGVTTKPSVTLPASPGFSVFRVTAAADHNGDDLAPLRYQFSASLGPRYIADARFRVNTQDELPGKARGPQKVGVLEITYAVHPDGVICVEDEEPSSSLT